MMFDCYQAGECKSLSRRGGVVTRRVHWTRAGETLHTVPLTLGTLPNGPDEAYGKLSHGRHLYRVVRPIIYLGTYVSNVHTNTPPHSKGRTNKTHLRVESASIVWTGETLRAERKRVSKKQTRTSKLKANKAFQLYLKSQFLWYIVPSDSRKSGATAVSVHGSLHKMQRGPK